MFSSIFNKKSSNPMIEIRNFNKYPIVGIHMPSYEIKSKQLNYNDFSVIIVINT